MGCIIIIVMPISGAYSLHVRACLYESFAHMKPLAMND